MSLVTKTITTIICDACGKEMQKVPGAFSKTFRYSGSEPVTVTVPMPVVSSPMVDKPCVCSECAIKFYEDAIYRLKGLPITSSDNIDVE